MENNSDKSLSEVHESIDISSKKNLRNKFFAFLGPAYLVAVGYMDPGNWATDLAGGSKYGYALIWVLVMSNVMAIVLQSLCARLGIVYRRDLAQVNRETYPPLINFCLYILAELAIAATDLAEVIGMAIGLNLLFGLPLIWGVTITVFDTFLLLYLQKLGIRKMEAFIISLIAVIFGSFVVELFLVKPDFSQILRGVKPSLPDNDALYIAIGIIGATVMPHNLYLHSALVQTRKIGHDEESIKKALTYNLIDSTIALNLALFVNASILILAGTVFYKNGLHEIESIEKAHELLAPLVGTTLAPILFAIALIAAGQSSTITGTLAGQIVMEGYLRLRINPWIRRLLTRAVAVIPAFIVIIIAGEEKMTDLLILSQVILSIQLAFAIIPLIYAVSNKQMMKAFTIKPWLIILSILITGTILYLNIKMVLNESFTIIQETKSVWIEWCIYAGLVLFGLLLLVTILYPLYSKRKEQKTHQIHNLPTSIDISDIKAYKKIALALDFSPIDQKVISHGIKQATKETEIILIHVLESAPAKILGDKTADLESEHDQHQLNIYKNFLNNLGYNVKAILGYHNRIEEISSICKENNIELLIMGAHGHKGFSDYLHGHTIEGVRHRLNIPILIVK